MFIYFFIIYFVLSSDELGIRVLQKKNVLNLLLLNTLLLTILFYIVIVNCTVLHGRFSFRFVLYGRTEDVMQL